MKRTTKLTSLLMICLFVLLGKSASGADEPIDIGQLEEQALKAAVDRVAPCVVRIETIGGLLREGRHVFSSGPTTGLIVSADGHIISSAAAFARKPTSILVQLPSGRRTTAKILAADHSRKLVLLKVDVEEKLPVPEAAPRESMQVGQWAVAVGRTFPGPLPNMSVGVLSATGRIWGRAIQTDAKVSPGNYGGPLVDIRGRVLGVLAPLSPNDNSATAGSEWYDSGVGFAVPLVDVQAVLPRLIKGENLHRGIMGVSLDKGGSFAPAKIAACRANSPAHEADLQPGDVVVELDGRPVNTQAQFKQLLGPRYAGDRVKLVVTRNEKQHSFELTLTDKLAPFEHPLLGILPLRRPADAKPAGIVVRYVYPNRGAAAAGILPGDRIITVNAMQVTKRGDAIAALLAIPIDEAVTVRLIRDGATKQFDVKLTAQPTEIPPQLPPARLSQDAAGKLPSPVGIIHPRLDEFKNKATAYIPTAYDPAVPHGVVVWLHGPGGDREEELLLRWKKHCDERDLILLAPKAVDPRRWQRGELDVIRKLLDQIVRQYTIDPARVVVAGRGTGGTLAYLAAYKNRDAFRAVAVVNAPPPLLVHPPETDPVHPLAIFATTAKKSPAATRITAGLHLLR
ncbi:MAG: PDZ domain-containing protein, partial [Planctomycetes bacterium]|nr:PDZ domain-containing protein [Planctomycetota bacterium]